MVIIFLAIWARFFLGSIGSMGEGSRHQQQQRRRPQQVSLHWLQIDVASDWFANYAQQQSNQADNLATIDAMPKYVSEALRWHRPLHNTDHQQHQRTEHIAIVANLNPIDTNLHGQFQFVEHLRQVKLKVRDEEAAAEGDNHDDAQNRHQHRQQHQQLRNEPTGSGKANGRKPLRQSHIKLIKCKLACRRNVLGNFG